MIPHVAFSSRSSSNSKQFQNFTFIGNSSHKPENYPPEKLHFTPNNYPLNEVQVGDNWQITQIHTNKNLNQELQALGIEPGRVIELINTSDRGSVIISCDRHLIGIGKEIAHSILVTLAVC